MPDESNYFWEAHQFVSFRRQEFYPAGLFADVLMYFFEPGVTGTITLLALPNPADSSMALTAGTHVESDEDFDPTSIIGSLEYDMNGTFVPPGATSQRIPYQLPRVRFPYWNLSGRDQTNHINGTWHSKWVRYTNGDYKDGTTYFSDTLGVAYNQSGQLNDLILSTTSKRMPGQPVVFDGLTGTNAIITEQQIMLARCVITTEDLSGYGQVPSWDPEYYKLGRITFGHV